MPALAASIQTLAIGLKRNVEMLLLFPKSGKHLTLAIPVFLLLRLCSSALLAEEGLQPLIAALTSLILCSIKVSGAFFARGAAIALYHVVQVLSVAWCLKRGDRVYGATP